MKKGKKTNPILYIALIGVLVLVTVLNVYALSSISNTIKGSKTQFKGLDKVDLSKIANTGQAIASLYPLDEIKTQEDAIELMIPTGTPEYGEQLGVSYDDPLAALDIMYKRLYPQIKAELKQDPELWQRYINLATKPVGISCEFCCGVGPVGITKTGELKCGCSHNPAVQGLTMWLMKNTEYNDVEILREVLTWKTLWYPKNMIDLGVKAAGGDIDLNALPSMVGGC